MIVSCDDWNRRAMKDVLVLEAAYGHDTDTGPYYPLVTVEDDDMTIYADHVFEVAKEDLADTGIELDDEAMAEVDKALDRVLSVPGGALWGVASARASRPRYRGQMCMADLQIPGERDKPVVVVSSGQFAHDMENQLVWVVRATGNANNPRDYEVVLTARSGEMGYSGKAVCSALRGVRSDRLRDRTPGSGQAVSASDQQAIMELVRKVVGLR